MSPTLSVIVPMYNCAPFLTQAIESIIQQGIAHTEIICIDDASTDTTLETARRVCNSNMKVLSRDQNGGIAAARNTATPHASGLWLAFLDADDLWVPGAISRFLSDLEQSQEVWGFAGIGHFADTPEIASKVVVPSTTKGFFAGNMLIKKDAFHKVGLFNETLRVGEFIDWFSRARSVLGEPIRFNYTVLRRRIHGSNTSRLAADPQVRAGYLKAIAHAIKTKQNEPGPT